jgi:predicted extracellular nuclease
VQIVGLLSYSLERNAPRRTLAPEGRLVTSARLRRRIALTAALPLALGGSLAALQTTSADAVSTSLVLAEVYGGGGNAGPPEATYHNDFIELRNVGATTVDVSSYSVQYASAAGSSWQVTGLSGKIPAGGAYLIVEASGGDHGAALPAPDATGNINMSASAGKIALVSSTSALGCGATCHADPSVVDYVGYGGSASDYEGSGRAPAGSNVASDARNASFADTDDNAADFTSGAPTPANCASTGTCAVAQDTTIAQIQGAAQISPLKGDAVTGVTGIVTADNATGFWMQDPRGSEAPGYVDGASSGIYVFTSSAPTGYPVGSAVTVAATVSEFRPGAQGLTTTELTNPTVTVTGSGQPLPDATLVGPGGLEPPTSVIDHEGTPEDPINVETEGSYDPSQDGIDFWESLEGMRIEIDDARAVGPTATAYGETPIVPAGAGPETARGGIVLLPTDPNPERIVLDDSLGTFVPSADTGDTDAGPVLGVVDYDFNNFHLRATATPTLVSGGIQREVADPAGPDELSVATFNVENLDPTDPQSKFDDLAQIIVDNLQAPDLLALEEVQDNNGATDNGVVDANVTLQTLVDAITDAGGPTYDWQQINPVNDAEGGEPGGNIRVAFLIQQGTPLSFVERDRGDSTTATHVETIDGQAALTHSPGRVDPSNPAWAATRVPLAGEFFFGGQKVFVIANHWSSKGGDDPLFGPVQPPVQASEPKRVQQAAAVAGFVDEITAVDPTANVVVMGDLNDFEYSDSVTTLTADGERLLDLPSTLPDAERYTYVYEGNSQVLDHIALSPALGAQGYDYDVVHVNAEFSDQASDHDPQRVDLHLGLPQATLSSEVSDGRIKQGSTVTVSGGLTDTASGTGLDGEQVTLSARIAGSRKWKQVDSTTTGADGSYAFAPQAPNHNARYRVTFAGDETYAPATSAVVRVKVASRVRINVSPRHLAAGAKVLVSGAVIPAAPGASVDVQVYDGDTWTTLASPILDRDSLYTYRWTTDAPGTYLLRVVKPRDSRNVTGFSAQITVVVH